MKRFKWLLKKVNGISTSFKIAIVLVLVASVATVWPVAASGQDSPELMVTEVDESSVRLKWESTSSSENHMIYRNGGYYDQVSSENTWTDTNVTAGDTYSYYVVGYESARPWGFCCFTDPSNTVEVVFTATATPILSLSGTTDDSISLQWQPGSPADYHFIYRDGQYYDYVSSTNTWTDTEVIPGVTYTYEVQGWKNSRPWGFCCPSEMSNAVEATTSSSVDAFNLRSSY